MLHNKHTAAQLHPTEPNILSLLGALYTQSTEFQVGLDFELFVPHASVMVDILVCAHKYPLDHTVWTQGQIAHRHNKRQEK